MDNLSFIYPEEVYDYPEVSLEDFDQDCPVFQEFMGLERPLNSDT